MPSEDILNDLRNWHKDKDSAIESLLKADSVIKNEYKKGCGNNSFDADPAHTIAIFGAICNINYFE